MVTRRESLEAAISALTSCGQPEMASKLSEMLSEMPCARWTRASIIDAFLDWYSTHGYFPASRSLDNIKSLPCHGSIKNCFGVSYPEFKKSFLDEYSGSVYVAGYGWTNVERLKSIFAEEYERIHPFSPRKYNKLRTKGTPSALSIARAVTPEGTWDALVNAMGFVRYYPRRPVTLPKGFVFEGIADSPYHRFMRLMEETRETRERVDAILAKYDNPPAGKRHTHVETYTGGYEHEVSIGQYGVDKS